jgi:hypothetical protein
METVLPPCSTRQQCPAITTSLYELIEALQNKVGPEDDARVVATVAYLLRSQRTRLLRYTGTSHCN